MWGARLIYKISGRQLPSSKPPPTIGCYAPRKHFEIGSGTQIVYIGDRDARGAQLASVILRSSGNLSFQLENRGNITQVNRSEEWHGFRDPPLLRQWKRSMRPQRVLQAYFRLNRWLWIGSMSLRIIEKQTITWRVGYGTEFISFFFSFS